MDVQEWAIEPEWPHRKAVRRRICSPEDRCTNRRVYMATHYPTRKLPAGISSTKTLGEAFPGKYSWTVQLCTKYSWRTESTIFERWKRSSYGRLFYMYICEWYSNNSQICCTSLKLTFTWYAVTSCRSYSFTTADLGIVTVRRKLLGSGFCIDIFLTTTAWHSW